MKHFDVIKKLAGETILESDLQFVDCYVRPQLALFIQTSGPCGYAVRKNHSHPSYMLIIYFDGSSRLDSHYYAELTSPNIPHNDKSNLHYYCILINKEYFEKRYYMYSEELPVFREERFLICRDILKTLNTFAFESGKAMPHSDITLDAQAEIITHWIIRSLLGENLDMRAVSSDYSVARAQNYMEQHFSESITVSTLAKLGYISPSSLNRRFKKETGATPIEYLIEIRIEHAKILLRRKNIPITEIALRCGFGSSAHFSSCFTQRLGITPTEYQSKYMD